MSTMLEQAIVDAEALKGAAVKNAEQAVIEKYAEEIKEAVDSLLEQPEDELGVEEEIPDIEAGLPGEEELEGEIPPMVGELPDAAADGEKLCGCPEEEEQIELNLDDLEKEVQAALQSGEAGLAPAAPQPGLAGELALEEEIEIDLEEEIIKSLLEDEGEEFSIEEESDSEADEISEKLTIDAQVSGHGHLGFATDSEVHYAEDIAKALEAAEAVNEKSKEKNDKLTRRAKGLLETNNKLETKLEKYGEKIRDLKEHISQVNISNARLLYMNRILGSTSLNERQKTKIVEALSKASSISEAKVIYETLQNSVGSSQKRNPKSLSEAVERRSSLLLSGNRQKETASNNPVQNRWKKLAGIID